MSEGKDTPRFTVVDRRKFRGDDEAAAEVSEPKASAPVAAEPEAKSAPRLTLVEPVHQAVVAETPVAVAEQMDDDGEFSDELGDGQNPELPPAPSAEESRFQKAAYDKAAERLDDLVRAQNPAAPPAEKIGFEHVVQQFYLSAMMQMGAGTPEGQRPRIDILGARADDRSARSSARKNRWKYLPARAANARNGAV